MLLHRALPLNDPQEFITSAGERFASVFSPTVLPDGNITLTEISKTDIQEQLNAAAVGCDVSVMVKRLLAGDTTVPTTNRGLYADFTKFPTDYGDILNLVVKLDSTFDSLPLDIREKFSMDKFKWLASVNSPEWLAKMGFSSPDVPAVDTSVELKKDVIADGQKQ